MSRILLAAHATVGHTNALRSIGRSFRADGDAVAMILPVARVPRLDIMPEVARTAAAIPEAVRRDDIEVFRFRPAWSGLWHALRLPRAKGYDELCHAMALFCAGMTEQARQVESVARSWHADVVVGDYLFFASWLGARLANVPFVAFFHSALPFPASNNPPFGSGLPNGAPVDPAWRAAERRLNQVLAIANERVATATRRLGLEPPRTGFMTRPYSDDLNLLATLPELEPGLDPLEGPVVFTGPCLAGRAREDGDHPALAVLREDKQRVYVSLGTVFNANPRAFEAILRGLDGQELQVIVSAGASADWLRKNPPSRNSHVFARVPQVALLERVDLVVTHGGNNTVQESLAAGRPMLVLPFGGDQLENARRIERLGAGIALLPSALSSQNVRSEVNRLLADPEFAERAAAAARALSSVDGTRRAVDAVRELIHRGLECRDGAH